MECGIECVMLSVTGVLTMPEWCAANLAFQDNVRILTTLSELS